MRHRRNIGSICLNELFIGLALAALRDPGHRKFNPVGTCNTSVPSANGSATDFWKVKLAIVAFRRTKLSVCRWCHHPPHSALQLALHFLVIHSRAANPTLDLRPGSGLPRPDQSRLYC